MSNQQAIVLPIDFSDLSQEALPWARRMAAITKGKIHCIYAVDIPQVYSALGMTPTIQLPNTDDLGKSARKKLSTFVIEHLGDQENPPTIEVLIGRPAEEIVDYARDIDAAMIVMTTHGYSGLRHVVLGSTTESVLRHADCPVLSIRSTIQSSNKRG